MLAVWNELERFIPGVRTEQHLLFLLKNQEKVNEYPDFESVIKQITGKHFLILQAIKRICKRNGLPHITMHGLRHMFATILIEQSVSLEKISKLMGHKSVATTFEIYCGIMEAKKEIAKTIDSVMDPAIGAVKVRSKGGIVCM